MGNCVYQKNQTCTFHYVAVKKHAINGAVWETIELTASRVVKLLMAVNWKAQVLTHTGHTWTGMEENRTNFQINTGDTQIQWSYSVGFSHTHTLCAHIKDHISDRAELNMSLTH